MYDRGGHLEEAFQVYICIVGSAKQVLRIIMLIRVFDSFVDLARGGGGSVSIIHFVPINHDNLTQK